MNCNIVVIVVVVVVVFDGCGTIGTDTSVGQPCRNTNTVTHNAKCPLIRYCNVVVVVVVVLVLVVSVVVVGGIKEEEEETEGGCTTIGVPVTMVAGK